MRERWKNMRSRLTPPGYNVNREVLILKLCCGAAAAFAMIWFLCSMSTHMELLYRTVNGKKILRPEHIFGYTEMMGWALVFYLVPMLVSLVNIGNRYFYLKTDSQSIYTMKRLASPQEIPARCLVMPLISLAATLIPMLLTVLVTWCLYLLMLVKAAIPADAGVRLLSQLIHWWHFT